MKNGPSEIVWMQGSTGNRTKTKRMWQNCSTHFRLSLYECVASVKSKSDVFTSWNVMPGRWKTEEKLITKRSWRMVGKLEFFTCCKTVLTCSRRNYSFLDMLQRFYGLTLLKYNVKGDWYFVHKIRISMVSENALQAQPIEAEVRSYL